MRDDALALYGFHSEQERDLFLMLLSRAGRRPEGRARGALRRRRRGSWSARSPRATRARFQAVPGIGKRTAERIIVELREKVGVDADAASAVRTPIVARRGEAQHPRELARDGLLELGYAPGEAEELLADAEGDERRGADRGGAAPGAGGIVSAMSETAARIQTPYLVAEDELDRSLRPRRLEEFVGQETLREQLAVAIEAARARGEALDHLLLAGPAGPRQDLARADRGRRARRAVRADRRARRSSARATSPPS